jgi:hypothetical protein
MHRPPKKEREISLEKGEKHVRDVDAAIFHLLHTLFEHDPVIKRLQANKR